MTKQKVFSSQQEAWLSLFSGETLVNDICTRGIKMHNGNLIKVCDGLLITYNMTNYGAWSVKEEKKEVTLRDIEKALEVNAFAFPEKNSKLIWKEL